VRLDEPAGECPSASPRPRPKQRLRKGQSETRGRLEVVHDKVAIRLRHRQVARLRSLENPRHVIGCELEGVGLVDAV